MNSAVRKSPFPTRRVRRINRFPIGLRRAFFCGDTRAKEGTTMKRLITFSVFAAAALVAVAGSASAQTLKAEIPFSFRAGKTLMGPGTYDVVVDKTSATRVFRLHNRESNVSVMLIGNVQDDAAKAWREAGLPKITFECVETRCALRRIWTGGDSAYRFLGPKPGADGAVRVAEIRLSPATQ
jgi:hypothetical protein